jgi:aspartate ammonia-lyase
VEGVKRRPVKFRKETDSLGEKSVPANAYYGIFTQRALENFPPSGLKPDREFLYSIAEIKLAAAKANFELGLLEKKVAKAIEKAAREVLHGDFDRELVLDAITAGAGTPFNMNLNEVIANRAGELLGGRKGRYDLVHPNDHVNLGQSSNDVIPTAIRITALKLLDGLLAHIDRVIQALERNAGRFRRTLKSARTHLQDAVPITLGQGFEAYGAALSARRRRISTAGEQMRKLGIGATAVGTGINSHPRYAKRVVEHLRKITRLRLESKENLVEATSSMADTMELADAIDEYAIELNRLSNDLRLLASGPHTGLNEIKLPEVEPGSSIMPGKVNPSVPEMVNMACFHVFGSVQAIRHAVQGGQLDLNVFTPTIALHLLASMRILGNASRVLAEKCLRGLEANEEVCRSYLERSAGIATALTPLIGYARAAELVKKAAREGRSVREVLIRESGLKKEELSRWLDPLALTRPNLISRRRR